LQGYYDVLEAVYDRDDVSEEPPLQALVKIELLRGLGHASSAIRTKAAAFWNHQTRLPGNSLVCSRQGGGELLKPASHNNRLAQ
jgi:hypothetical protein